MCFKRISNYLSQKRTAKYQELSEELARLEQYEVARTALESSTTTEKFFARLHAQEQMESPESHYDTLLNFFLFAGDDSRFTTAAKEELSKISGFVAQHRTKEGFLDCVAAGVIFNLRNALLDKSSSQTCLERVRALIDLFEVDDATIEFCMEFALRTEAIQAKILWDFAERISGARRTIPKFKRYELRMFRDKLLREARFENIESAYLIHLALLKIDKA
jgi:hypothetical protein